MPTYFPSISVTDAIIQHWDALPPDWKSVTDTYQFQDGGEDFNEVSDNAPKRWHYEVVIPRTSHALAKGVADVYDAFFNEVRYSQPFVFTDKYGTDWSDVRIEEYDRSHDAHKSWIIYIKFVLKGSINTADVTGDLVDGSDLLTDG